MATESTSTPVGVQMLVVCEGFNLNYPFVYRCSVNGLLQSFEVLSLKQL